ncbi:MAG: DNA translocase FtsK [Clostridia bacterium]|nr:DNA translocase FtsK [Clostridia bacterium]
MAQKSAKKRTNNKSNKVTAKRKSPAAGKSKQMEIKEERHALWKQVAPYLLLLSALLITICLFTGRGEDPGVVLKFLYNFLTGIFGGAAFLIPVFLAYAAISDFLDRDEAGLLSFRFIFAVVSALLVSVFLELVSPAGGFNFAEMYSRGATLAGGGIVGGTLGELFLLCFKSVGSFVLVIALLFLSVILTAGLTPKYLFKLISVKLAQRRERIAMEKEQAVDDTDTEEDYTDEGDGDGGFIIPEEEAYCPEVDEETGEVIERAYIPPVSKKRRRKFDTDVPLEENTEAEDGDILETPEQKRARINEATFEEVMRRSKETKSEALLAAERAVFENEENLYEEGSAFDGQSEEIAGSADPEGFEILDRLASEYEKKRNSSLKIDRKTVSEPEKASAPEQVEIEIPKPVYNYPPLNLLTEDPGAKATDVRAEYQENATKLVSVLSSFNVKTRIVGVSRGPTITRYELLPEAGTRVRSISNLVDDIALNLATSGVRIEAPIPGKAAVGIEVPNKQAETVYLRTLLSSDRFAASVSKLTTALGMDVAGEPIIMDIAKMPHLLIAGATGMGKSVCINCLLMSLLYKATPDEVKLILIDPKKVEFSIYNGLPHLLVPVVSDPKKAAGSLGWAVNEMERRFGLIESVGVRDIASYNKITAGDPDREFMPQIVIVIDELADLMSTAASDVETSIARLAAKARAAGMHLVIGTQRPSVDVITGVIKANIPSRIAFTVASQVDSRTIIDRSGAENLIGRGDMLYSPVGASKPIRVQGAFVSEKEVDSVVKFIKAQNMAGAEIYNDEVMKEIEAQAALCGVKKGSGGAPAGADGADASEGDPLMAQAMEVAFESGKISTSLLQRRLSVGYGRAAKIIDHMEKMGYVSAPEGQKPREVLITKDQFMELQVKNEEI